jgi:hypothetical protein
VNDEEIGRFRFLFFSSGVPAKSVRRGGCPGGGGGQEGGGGGRAGLSEREYIGICFVYF